MSHSLSVEELGKIDWSDISQRLTLFAKWRLGSDLSFGVAEELAQEAIRQFFDPHYLNWDREANPDLKKHLGSIVNGLIRNYHRKKRPTLGLTENLPQVGSQGQSPDSMAINKDLAHKIIDVLITRIDNDPRAVDSLYLFLEGCDQARDQAERLKCNVKDIYNARRRLDGHFRAIQDQLQEKIHD